MAQVRNLETLIDKNSKLTFDAASQSPSFEIAGFDKLGTLKMATCDPQVFPDRGDRSESFVLDMESLARSTEKDVTANSRITLQRSLSRKGSQREERKMTATLSSISTSERGDSTIVASADDDSNKGAAATTEAQGLIECSTTAKKTTVVAMGTTEPMINGQQGQMMMMMMNNNNKLESFNRCNSRRYSGRRSSWFLDPRRVVVFFATLSSMGTILLIYFTLSISNNHLISADDYSHSRQ
ncbi:PREDICTED: uncharacterized protein LOC104585675 isoform X2 [Nelumbo nucifera]|uniref:Uncharacterized protein LOC104585675 isoform X2 n=1 Tax=Nelumbo nucifera TaxID=4432 RepID=A0A1U7YQ20_NELNU|nr:PREDICTED: uncharacterized protein LOC104585675 isoform X2 [Nelumbo nucifera]